MTLQATAPVLHVGIFDSGVGGLSVLRSVRAALPHARLTYLADNRNVPYGDKSPEWLTARCAELTQRLLDHGAGLILLACNTATTHTIATLRTRWPDVPFVGIEPGIKPAVRATHNQRIAVMATPATLGSVRVKELVALHGGGCHVRLLPCPGLATAIEEADDDQLERLLEDACDLLRREAIDTVVLGCTHYPLVAEQIAARLGQDVRLIDTAEAVTRRTIALLSGLPAQSAELGNARITCITTGSSTSMARALERWIPESVYLQQHAW